MGKNVSIFLPLLLFPCYSIACVIFVLKHISMQYVGPVY